MEKIYLRVKQATKCGYIDCCLHGAFDMSYPNSKLRRGRVQGGGKITPTITSSGQILTFNDMEATKKRPEGKGWVWDEQTEKWFRIRKLTPKECFRLMDVSEEDIAKIQNARFAKNSVIPSEDGTIPISKSQQYKMAGNSIVVNVMALIFKNLFGERDEMEEGRQLTLF